MSPGRSARHWPDTPPLPADPRRIGALIGLIGGCVFVFSYGPVLPQPIFVGAAVLVVVLVAVVLWFLFVRPSWLGRFVPARPWQIGIYLAAVVGEFALIAAGSRWLSAAGRDELRPALIAAVIGLHFVPFAWAFGERMFYLLGAALIVLGGVGLLSGSAVGAAAAAVLAGMVMPGLLVAYSRGVFARDAPPPATSPG